jgi:PTH1 family peptidyl-tRNA hydrolase
MNIKAVIGLGNPGPEYENTFHNAGRMFVLTLANGTDFQKEKGFEYANAGSFYLILPNSNMNESGIAVKDAAKKFKIKPEEILTAQDDSDIALGEYKLSFGKNSAGHKGVESIIKSLGTKNFYRLRFGIRAKTGKAGEFVLRQIGKKEAEALRGAFYGAKESVIEKLKPPGMG